MKGFVNMGAIIGLVVGIILLFAVVLPITNTMIQSTAANLSGFTGANTVAQQLPILEVVGGLILVVGTFLFFGRQG